jgi:membrane protease YdiL (CAAX protease family)
VPQPSIVDHFLLFLLTVVLPAGGWISIRRLRRRLAKGVPYTTRATDYRNNILVMWTVAALLAVGWLILGRDWRLLGLTLPDGHWIGVVISGCIAAGLVGLDLYIYRRVQRSDSAARELVDQTAPFTMLLPHTRRELSWFYGLSLTAGITEELLYRGFLIAYLGAFVSMPMAIITSSAIFAIAHSYQGLSGSLRTFLVGLALAIAYVLSGSLLFPIIAHVLVDLISGRMIFDILRRPPEEAAVRDSC